MKKTVITLAGLLTAFILLTCEFVPTLDLPHDNPLDPDYVDPAGSSDKAITSFIFSEISAAGTIAETVKTIAVTVPAGTGVTALVPTIIHTGISISPASDTAQDFTDPATYTVTAENGTTADYTVTVTAALPVLTYDPRNASSGAVPVGSTGYQPDTVVTVLGNTGSLVGPVIQDGIRQVFIDWNTQQDGLGTAYDGDDTFAITEDTTLYAMFTSDAGVLRKLGPAGGWVFYDKTSYSDGWRYLEAAPEDQSTSQVWSNVDDALVPGTHTAAVFGGGNTLNIISQTGHTGSAALLCSDHSKDYGGSTYDDWFLPSKDELALMYENLHNQATPVGGFESNYYWSSSENNTTTAQDQNFDTGTQYAASKDSTRRVRAARIFSSSTSYQVRDRGPAHGWIFSVQPYGDDAWTYLEAESEDFPIGSAAETYAWSNVTGTDVLLGEHTDIGTGRHNTLFIIFQSGQTSSAAQLCSDYSLNGYSDWFLPSKDELNLMYGNLRNQATPVGGFGLDYYWSSSEASSLNAWVHHFNNGSQTNYPKEYNYRVRAARAF